MASLDDIHREMRAGFDRVEARLESMRVDHNGRLGTLERWKARMEGAASVGAGVWQRLGIGAAVLTSIAAIAVALTQRGV